jgi:hypothetical protein
VEGWQGSSPQPSKYCFFSHPLGLLEALLAPCASGKAPTQRLARAELQLKEIKGCCLVPKILVLCKSNLTS